MDILPCQGDGTGEKKYYYLNIFFLTLKAFAVYMFLSQLLLIITISFFYFGLICSAA